MKRVFTDTNIILDWLLVRPNFSKAALALFSLAEDKEIIIATSAVSIINTEYFLRKSLGNSHAREVIRELRIICDVVDAGKEEVDLAVTSDFKDFEDAYQYHCALSWKADVIVTRDKKGFKRAELPVLNAQELIVYLNGL